MKSLYNFLRFFNILEPRRWVLSISKIFLWSTIFAFVYTVFEHPDQTVAILTLLFANGLSTTNYMYRRHVQMKAGNTDAAASISVDNSGK